MVIFRMLKRKRGAGSLDITLLWFLSISPTEMGNPLGMIFLELQRLMVYSWALRELNIARKSFVNEGFILVGGLVAIWIIFPEILGISSSQLTLFFRGVQTTNQL